MSTLQNTDVFAVTRGTTTYKVSFADVVAGVPLPPVLFYKGSWAPTATAPAPAGGLKAGMVYVLTPAGTLDASWIGIGGRHADDGQLAIWEGAKWELVGDSGAIPDATETVKGIVELATAAETTTGTDATRAVHPAGLKVELDKKVNKAGDTMTGNLTVPKLISTGDVQAASLNGGPLAGTRNVLINGDLRVNQRGVNISAAPVGTYGPDRWKRTTGGMTQIVSAANYQPSTQYTLSGTGVTTRQITSPASGDWTIPDVPITAKNIQLEPGPVATPFEHRPISVELQMCQYYYLRDENWQMGYSGYGTPPNPASYALYYPPMRAIPSVKIAFSSGVNVASVSVSFVGNQYITVSAQANASGFMYWVSSGITIDAEF